MGKPDQGSAAAEGARRATGDAAGPGRGGRLSVGRKREVVLRLLRGEDLESVSRAVGITAARASQGRDRFLAAGQASLKSRAPPGWTCPSCQEGNEGQFVQCWNCGANGPEGPDA